MAGTTPVFGIPYPEMSDPMDPAVFAAEANAIDTVLAGTDALLASRMYYPALNLNFASSAVLAPATPTLATFTAERYDTHGMFSAAFPQLIFCPLAGIYAVTLTNGLISGYASRTSTRFAILVNAVTQYAEQRYPSSASSDEVSLTGLVRLNLNDQITVQYQFTGAGNANFVVGDLAVEFVCPLV